jgi:hypothetical protein
VGEKTHYLLAGQASELDRLRLQSRVWEPAGRRLADAHGAELAVRSHDALKVADAAGDVHFIS